MGLGIFQIHALFINDGQSQRDCNAKRLNHRGTEAQRTQREQEHFTLCPLCLCASVVPCFFPAFFPVGG